MEKKKKTIIRQQTSFRFFFAKKQYKLHYDSFLPAPIPFGGGEDSGISAMSGLFCKSRASRCVFPFTDAEGNAHEECVIDEDGEGREFAWCATRVDEQVRFFLKKTAYLLHFLINKGISC